MLKSNLDQVTKSAKRILYIEDDVLISLSQKKVLAKQGFKVTHVFNGEKALELLNNHQFDIVLSDIDLGKGIDGTETAKRILAKIDIPIVFISSHSEKDTANKVGEVKNYGYMIKSAGEYIINQTIRSALSLFEAHKQQELSEIRFRALFQNLNTSASLYEVLTDDQGKPVDYRYIEVNREFEKISGRLSSELIGKSLLQMYPDTEQYWVESLRKVALTGESMRITEYSKYLEKYLEIMIYSPQRGQLAMLGIDITEKKLAEKAIAEKERRALIGDMASASAHDINNSLQIILANAEIAYSDQETSTRVKESILNIKNASRGISSAVQRLQREAGLSGFKNIYETINVENLIKDAVSQAKPFWKDGVNRNGMEILIELSVNDKLFIEGNKLELINTLINLFKNSVEAMVATNKKRGVLSVSTVSENDQAYIRIKDTGIGMDQQTKDNLFNRYYSTKGSGRGYGMNNVRTSIESHGGTISVKESTPGVGTTLEIVMPAVVKQAVEIKAENDISHVTRPIRILLVDDEEMIRGMSKTQLAHLGHDADTASSGMEALKMLKEKAYDCVITDMSMPGMSGLELAEKIRIDTPSVNVILATGYAAEITDQQQQRYGISKLLGKPYTMNDLKNSLIDIKVPDIEVTE